MGPDQGSLAGASHNPHTSPEALNGHCDPRALDVVECGGWAYLGQSFLLPMVEHCPKTWQMGVGGAPV